MRKLKLLPILLLAGCAGLSRDCSHAVATSFGADWVVVQLNAQGEPARCWKLDNTAVDNEEHSDGIFWKASGGHLLHISGWYNRAQVAGGNFDEAAQHMGVDLARCTGGAYSAK